HSGAGPPTQDSPPSRPALVGAHANALGSTIGVQARVRRPEASDYADDLVKLSTAASSWLRGVIPSLGNWTRLVAHDGNFAARTSAGRISGGDGSYPKPRPGLLAALGKRARPVHRRRLRVRDSEGAHCDQLAEFP